jgi:hypothetical protein
LLLAHLASENGPKSHGSSGKGDGLCLDYAAMFSYLNIQREPDAASEGKKGAVDGRRRAKRSAGIAP